MPRRDIGGWWRCTCGADRDRDEATASSATLAGNASQPVELIVELVQPRARLVELVLDVVGALPGVGELGVEAADVIVQRGELTLQPRDLG